MAYNLKYNFKWTDTGGANREFEIYEDGFAGTSESIPYSNASPMSVRMRGDQENTDNIINGQEFTFEIVVSDPADRHKFDPLFESDFQDFYGQYKKNGTVINKGWLKPENLEKDAENPQPRITLSFTDGLADLKDIEFVKSDGSFYTGEMTMLEVIKEALDKMGSEIAARDFRIISNLHEFNLMTTDANGMANDANLRVSTIDTRRFVNIEGGKTQADDCYTVIEKILFNFNVKLKVVNDQYWIVDYNESAYADENFTNGETFVHEVLWTDLTATGHTRTAINNAITLGGKQYRRGGNLTKLHPLKGYDLVYKNKYLGSVPDANVNDWNSWTVNGAVSSAIDGDGVLNVEVDSGDDSCFIESPEFDITEEAAEEYIKLLFQHIWDIGVNDGTPLFHIEMHKPWQSTGTRFKGQTNYFIVNWKQYISPNNNVFLVSNLGDTSTSTYQLRIVVNFTPVSAGASTNVKFQPPELRKIVPIDTIGGQTVTRDKNFIITQSGGRGYKELTSYFGDAEDTFDIGRITISGTVTSVWNHLQNNQISISEQILKHKLTNRQSYADIIRFDYLDTDDDISLEKVIKIGSNYYEIIGLDKEYRQGNATITVRQIFTTIVTYTITEGKIASADDSTTSQGYGDTGGSSGSGGGGDSGGDNPTFHSNEFFLEDDFWFDSQNNFNFNNVSTDRTLFSLYNDDLGGTSNFLASFDYDLTNDAFKINQANLDLSGNDITNINNFGGGGTAIGVDDDLNLGGTSSLTNINELDFGGTTVNEISTTIDGTSTNNQFVTALAVKNYVDNNAGGAENLGELNDVSLGTLASGELLQYDGANWVNATYNLEDARGVDNTVAGAIDMGGNNLIGIGSLLASGSELTLHSGIGIRDNQTDEHWFVPDDLHMIRFGPSGSTDRHSVFWYRLASNAQSPNGHAFEVNMDSGETMSITGGALQLNAGTSVNEIVTTIDGTSTDDQLPTAAAVNDRISGWGLEDARNASATFSGAWSFDAGYTIDWGGGEIVNITILEALGNANQLSLGNLSGSNIAMLVEDGSGGTNISTEWESTSGNFRIHQRAYKNGHLNYTNLNNQSLDAQYKLMPDGTVIFKGAISTWDSNGVAQDTIPNEARPPEDLTFFVNQRGSTTGYTLTFHSDGTISNEEGAEFPPTDLNLGVVRYDLN